MYKLGTFYCQLNAGIKEEGFRDIAEAFSEIRKVGVEGVDFNQKEIGANTPTLLASTDMFAASVHGALPLEFKTDKLYNESTVLMKEAIDKAVYVKSPFFMAVPQRPALFDEADRTAFVEAARSLIKELCGYAKNLPIQVTIEDYSTTDAPYATYEDIDALLDANPDLGFTFDTGNFPLAGINEVEAAKRYANRTVYIHMKDIKVVEEETNIFRMGKYFDSCEIGGGYLENRHVLEIIRASGFTDGVITLEVNSEHTRFKRTVDSVKWINKVLEDI